MEWRFELKKNEKKFFVTALAMAIKKDPTTSIRKQVNELIVHEKTLGTAIKQDLSLYLYPLITLYGAF